MLERDLCEGILLTDQYQLTMAQLYFRMGLHERQAQFDHFFRSYPGYDSHQAGYCINAGLGWLLDWMRRARFTEREIELLHGQKGRGGKPVFAEDFLEWLRENGSFEGIKMRSVPEGRVVHPGEPLNIVQGPLAMAQILETALLNQLNFQILIATKAARMRHSCGGSILMEFGARRAHDLGANAGARAAVIGGADFSSNVGISHMIGLPPKGTHAHSMVQAFMAMGEGEIGAFRAYAEVYPDDCLLLVDTVDTLESGVPNAIKVFEELKRKGHAPVGIRLDSGDLAYLSIQAARALNKAGFPDAKIVLSNQLDEMVIWQIKTQIREEASGYGVDPDDLMERLVYGIGTRLITSRGDSALDGIYKLVALQDGRGRWAPAIKLSETPEKVINPGDKGLWRLYDRGNRATADLVSLVDEDPRQERGVLLHHPVDEKVTRSLEAEELLEVEPLLVVTKKEGNAGGELPFARPSLDELREARDSDLKRLNSGVRRLVNPHRYHVSLTRRLWDLKQELIRSAGGKGGGGQPDGLENARSG